LSILTWKEPHHKIGASCQPKICHKKAAFREQSLSLSLDALRLINSWYFSPVDFVKFGRFWMDTS
jgi:hypothetical protein